MPVVHVVDDDASFLVALARLLKAAGYAVQTYASAADFLAKLGDGAGCVITDLRMPGMDGLDLQHAAINERPTSCSSWATTSAGCSRALMSSYHQGS
jgi:FixJ family two-component response regulator